MRHEQTTIEHDGQRADVDAGIASLILAMWRAGFETCGSCENMNEAYGGDFGHLAMVGFRSLDEARRFKRLVPTGKLGEIIAEDKANATEGLDAAAAVCFPAHGIEAVLRRVVRAADEDGGAS